MRRWGAYAVRDPEVWPVVNMVLEACSTVEMLDRKLAACMRANDALHDEVSELTCDIEGSESRLYD